MNSTIYNLYKRTKKLISRFEKEDNAEEFGYLNDLKEGNTAMEESNPYYLERYNIEARLQASFSQEQKDFICYQIGEWYGDWKNYMILSDGTHRLGYAKELLKTMICGD